MADVETTIKTSGGDYASLALAEADDFGCTSGQTALCEYAEEMTDTTEVTFQDLVTSAVEISVQPAYRHGGDATAGAVLKPSSGKGLLIRNSGITVRHLRVDMADSNDNAIKLYNFTGPCTIDSLLVSSGDIEVASASATLLARRCSFSNTASAVVVQDAASCNFYFCTFDSADPAETLDSNSSTSTPNIYGCVVINTHDNNRCCTGTWGGDYNADTSTEASYQTPGANSAHSLTIANELTDPANGDYTIKSGGTGTLVDLVAVDTYNTYFPDISGNYESGSHPDCGAFEVAGGTPPTTGWGHKIMGVEPSAIEGVAVDDIEKINGV